ncbi:glycosyl transferase family 1 [Polynucleobacter paneuropaeus]|uniref:Glycosyl transferase family 1 n=2 Tax=Polynucleobacter paneuropaeus TaxID=2527775 RepID=A0A2Z4JUP5_9BURK|nr:glycosyl transferase family 1 [Polynucleobacter paneuropaeus]
MSKPSLSNGIRVHLTNVTGAGASQLLKSLLPALIRENNIHISEIYLPDIGQLSHFSSTSRNVVLRRYKRYMPKVISRFLECTFLAYKFNGDSPLLVLGDIPLRVRSPQILFLQSPHLTRPAGSKLKLSELKYVVARFIFRFNMNRVDAFIVQSKIMRDTLIDTYPSIRERVHVVSHPVPEWLLACKFQRDPIPLIEERGLRLIYPSADYPHKNHKILSKIQKTQSVKWPVLELKLTLNNVINPAPTIPWVHCVGFLSPSELIDAYKGVDALLFLSNKESFGFPLLEAMFLGLPVICPDLPYAHALCGKGAIYFDPDSIESLENALNRLKDLLKKGWKPDWNASLSSVPKSWDSVAASISRIAINTKKIAGCDE